MRIKRARAESPIRRMPMLTTFALYIHRRGEAPQFEPVLCADVAAAMTKARELLEEEASIRAIEVHLREECLVTVERPEAPDQGDGADSPGPST
jgi:hypothetical protein